MEKIFVDTSAFFSLVATEDVTASIAVDTWEEITQADDELITNNYVVVECVSLVQRRLGLEFVRYLQIKILPLVKIEWLDEERHTLAVRHMLAVNRRSLSLVDCSAFESMRRLRIETAFTFDHHFREEGFKVIP